MHSNYSVPKTESEGQNIIYESKTVIGPKEMMGI